MMQTGEKIKVTGQMNKTGEIVYVSKYIVVVKLNGINGINECFTLADFAAQDRYKFYIYRDGEYKAIPKVNIGNLKLVQEVKLWKQVIFLMKMNI